MPDSWNTLPAKALFMSGGFILHDRLSLKGLTAARLVSLDHSHSLALGVICACVAWAFRSADRVLDKNLERGSRASEMAHLKTEAEKREMGMTAMAERPL